MRHGGLWARLPGLLLITMIIALGIAGPTQAAKISHVSLQMVAAPDGGLPDEAPPLLAMIEAEAGKLESSSPLHSDETRSHSDAAALQPSAAQLFQQAAAATSRCLTTIRGYNYPRDPCLSLNPGHAPPRG